MTDTTVEAPTLTPLQLLEQRALKISPSLIETLHARLWKIQQICSGGSLRFFPDHDPMDLVWQLTDNGRHVMTGLLHFDRQNLRWTSHT